MSKQLGINPEMDKIARDNGLGHWSCVSPLDAGMWVRSDGCTYANDRFTDVTSDFIFNVVSKYPFAALKLCDEHKPIGKDWQQPTTELPEKTIVSNGCHDCPLLLYRDYTCLITKTDVLPCVLDVTRHSQCPLLTHTIKVVKNENN